MVIWVVGMGFGYCWGLGDAWRWGALHAKWPGRGRKRPLAPNAPNILLHHNGPTWHLVVCMVIWVVGMGFGYCWGLGDAWWWGALHAKWPGMGRKRPPGPKCTQYLSSLKQPQKQLATQIEYLGD